IPQSPPAAQPVEDPAPPAPAPEPEPARPNFHVPAVPGGPMTGLEQRLFDGINAERAAAGMAPYSYDATLTKIARTRAQQMVDQQYFGQTDPYGYSMYVELLAHFGISSYAWA